MKLFNIIDTTFENFDATIKAYLTKALGTIGKEYSVSQIYGIIFEGIKGIMQNAMFYIEDALTEQNIMTATRKKSVYSLAKISGYNAYYGSAASGKLIAKISVNNTLQSKTSKLYLYNYTKLADKLTGLTYSIILPTDYYSFDISKPVTLHEFKIVQGLIINSSYIASGFALETVHITSTQLFDSEYITVKVNGKKWHQASTLYDMGENEEGYVFETGYNSSFDIMFGDGIYGKKISNGDNISISYLVHAGTMGNISPNKSSQFIFSEYGYDSLGNGVNLNDYIDLYIDTCVSGGTDSDSVDFIRNMVGKNSRSLVYASEDSFKLFFKRFSFIGTINCWTNTNSLEVIVTCLRNIKEDLSEIDDYYKLYNKENILLTYEQKNMIQNTLENSKRSFGGIKLKFQDPVIRQYAIICYVKTDNVYNQELVRTEITRFLASFFLNLPDDTLFIAKSTIIKFLLDNIANIKSLDISIISELAEQTFKNGKYKKYIQKYINGEYKLDTMEVMYEPDVYPGLDNLGNIQLSSKIEIPILNGNFNYYIDKNDKLNKDSIMIPTVQVYFV